MGSVARVTLVEVSSEPEGRGSPAVVRVRGELDLAAVHAVRSALLVSEAARPGALAIDLGDVTHLDSIGLRVLLDAARRASEEDRRLIVVAPPEGPVGRILRLTLLSEHLHVVPDLEAAES